MFLIHRLANKVAEALDLEVLSCVENAEGYVVELKGVNCRGGFQISHEDLQEFEFSKLYHYITTSLMVDMKGD